MARIKEISTGKIHTSGSMIVFAPEYKQEEDETVVYFSDTDTVLFSFDGDAEEYEIDEMFFEDYEIV